MKSKIRWLESGSAVEITDYREPGFNSQQLHDCLQLSVILVPGGLTLFLASMGTSHAHSAYPYMQAKCAHKIKINLEKKTNKNYFALCVWKSMEFWLQNMKTMYGNHSSNHYQWLLISRYKSYFLICFTSYALWIIFVDCIALCSLTFYVTRSLLIHVFQHYNWRIVLILVCITRCETSWKFLGLTLNCYLISYITSGIGQTFPFVIVLQFILQRTHLLGKPYCLKSQSTMSIELLWT